MKYFTFLMAVYILVLSVLPCGDVSNDCNDTKTKTELTKNHSHEQDEDDNCSPFCICSCCNISVVTLLPKVYESQKPFFYKKTKVKLQNTNLFAYYNGNIWQPPKCVV